MNNLIIEKVKKYSENTKFFGMRNLYFTSTGEQLCPDKIIGFENPETFWPEDKKVNVVIIYGKETVKYFKGSNVGAFEKSMQEVADAETSVITSVWDHGSSDRNTLIVGKNVKVTVKQVTLEELQFANLA